MKLVRSLLPCTLLGALCAACLSKPDVPPRRYFVPVLPAEEATGGSTSQAASFPVYVTYDPSAPYGGTSMVWRRSEAELALDEDNKWVESPVSFLRIAVGRVLDRSGGVSPSVRQGGPRAQVELIAFEGRVFDRTAVVEAQVELQAPEGATYRERVRREVPLDALGPEALAASIGIALDELAIDLVAWMRARVEG